MVPTGAPPPDAKREVMALPEEEAVGTGMEDAVRWGKVDAAGLAALTGLAAAGGRARSSSCLAYAWLKMASRDLPPSVAAARGNGW